MGNIEREFQSLKMMEDTDLYTCYEGMKAENVTKNRYRNILPYDQTRVVLRGRNNSNGADYINASYIRTYGFTNPSSAAQSLDESLNSAHLKDKIYIAAQGCLSNTKNDFWRMIWQEDVRVIVMITNEIENGKVKCEMYWPTTGEAERYGCLSVRTTYECRQEDYILREFEVDDGRRSRAIYQYQFTMWPDQRVPDNPDGVLNFIEEINMRLKVLSVEEGPPEQNIICVHCSAGVGRTGTFIVLDLLMDKIKNNGCDCEINIHNTVKMVRRQRGRMVQNKAQFKFIHTVLRQYINNISNSRKVYKVITVI